MVEKLRLAGIVSGLTDPKTYKPILYIRTHIKGNVQGLPASVPIRLAIIDPFNIRAKRALMTRCRPIKGHPMRILRPLHKAYRLNGKDVGHNT